MPRLVHRALAMAAALLVASPLTHAQKGLQHGYKACRVGGICTPGTSIGGTFINGGMNGPLEGSGSPYTSTLLHFYIIRGGKIKAWVYKYPRCPLD
jgi:hypothetical protein